MFRKKYSDVWRIERRKKKKFCHRYNIIPANVLQSPILEFGAGEGIRQVECIHRKIFLESDYLGIDLLRPLIPELNIIQKNILKFNTNQKYKTVMAIGSLEHIALDKWPFIIRKLKNLCDNEGNIIIYVPYKESIDKYMINKGDHLVYGITKKFMLNFFYGANVEVIYDQMIRQYNESLIWAIGRWIKRVITLDKFALKIIPRRVGLLVIWKKENSND